MKNNGQIVREVLNYVDFAVVEECFYYNECYLYEDFIKVGKPVFEVEYNLSKEAFCKEAKKLGFSSAKACYELNGCWDLCE